MLGPVAVLPELQRAGVGKALMQETLKAADDQGVKAIMLIGDAEYYGMFGFDASHARQWDLPGPFERHRLLVRVPAGVKLPAAGAVGPRRGARSEEHTSELQSLMRIPYAVFCLKKKN